MERRQNSAITISTFPHAMVHQRGRVRNFQPLIAWLYATAQLRGATSPGQLRGRMRRELVYILLKIGKKCKHAISALTRASPQGAESSCQLCTLNAYLNTYFRVLSVYGIFIENVENVKHMIGVLYYNVKEKVSSNKLKMKWAKDAISMDLWRLTKNAGSAAGMLVLPSLVKFRGPQSVFLVEAALGAMWMWTLLWFRYVNDPPRSEHPKAAVAGFG
ncbi:MFS domain-containing protein [Forsythia ovata]|uniref:MFS domain-containing protein n=1 Tax=Forsythia ovata TaxID=205694 RepID=A0ABD1SM68_9LAMI